MDKLSALIRVGARLRLQTRRRLFRISADDGTITSCAIGAAIEAKSAPITDFDAANVLSIPVFLRSLDIDPEQQVEHPTGRQFSEYRHDTLWDLNFCITDLNDNCGWSREHVADWLEGLGL